MFLVLTKRLLKALFILQKQVTTTKAEGKELVLTHFCVIMIGTIMTGSWDKSIKVWDPRSPTPEIGHYPQPDKIYTMDMAPPSSSSTPYKLVVGMAGRHVYIYDLRKMGETLQERESSLKFMTRTLRCMPNGEGMEIMHRYTNVPMQSICMHTYNRK